MKKVQKVATNNWTLETWTIREFMNKSISINCNPVGQRPAVSTSSIGDSKPSKEQGIVNSIMKGGDIGEIIIVKLPQDNPSKFQYESIDGGHRKRAIKEFLANDFPLHKTSILKEVYAKGLDEEQLESFFNFKIRVVIYDNLTNREKGEAFRDTNNTTPVNNQETLNSYGDTPIANLIRQTARKIEGIESIPHELFTTYKTTSGNIVYPNIATNNTRLRLDELVARITYMCYRDEKPVVAPFEGIQSMYDSDPSVKDVKKIEKKLNNCLDFLYKCSMEKKAKLKKGLTYAQTVMLYRLYFYFKKTYGNFKIESYEKFWVEFNEAFNVFNSSNPKRDDIVENGRLIYEAFNQHLGEHKTQFKFDNTIQWILEEMNLEEATVADRDNKRVFPREWVEMKLADQKYKCWVSGEELDMDDAQGGHIASYSSGGKTEYDNLVVISAEHNRRMQDQNAHDYKEVWLAEQKKTA